MKHLIIATALLLATTPAAAERYERSTYNRVLTGYCEHAGELAALMASYRDDGFKEQAVSAILDRNAAKANDPRYIADAHSNLVMIYHGAGWMMSNPQDIGQGAYENCLAQHGAETWWREPTVAGAP